MKKQKKENLKTGKLNLITPDCVDDGVVPWIREVLQQVVKWSFPSHIVLNYESQEGQHCQSPIGKLLFLGLKCRSKVEGVENATRVSALVWGQAVLLEDGILVHTSWVLDVLPPSDLDVVEQYELDHK